MPDGHRATARRDGSGLSRPRPAPGHIGETTTNEDSESPMNPQTTTPTDPGSRPTRREAPSRAPERLERRRRTFVGGVRAVSRYLIAHGFERAEVGNLTAYLYGLGPVSDAWTVDEIERLLFARYLVSSGRLGS